MPSDRYNRHDSDMKQSDAYYRNWLDMEFVLKRRDDKYRRSIVEGIIQRNSEKEKKSEIFSLIYALRLKAIVLFFFPNEEKYAPHIKSLISHPGWTDPSRTKEEDAVLCGFVAAIDDISKGKQESAALWFTSADKNFGILRYTMWAASNKKK